MVKCCVTKEEDWSSMETKEESEFWDKRWQYASDCTSDSLVHVLIRLWWLDAIQPSVLTLRPLVLTAYSPGNFGNMASPAIIDINWAGHTILNGGARNSLISVYKWKTNHLIFTWASCKMHCLLVYATRGIQLEFSKIWDVSKPDVMALQGWESNPLLWLVNHVGALQVTGQLSSATL